MSLTPEEVRDIALGKGGSYGVSRDVIKHTIWDTRFFGAAVSSNSFFTQPINTNWLGTGIKTRNETNMLDTGKLPNGQTFLIKRIGVSLILPIAASVATAQTHVQAFYNIMQSSVFQIRIAGREFDFECHGSQFVPSVAVSAPTATDIASTRVGDVHASGWISLDYIPIFVGPMVTFSVAQTVENAHPALIAAGGVLPASFALLAGVYAGLQVKLDGVLTRAK